MEANSLRFRSTLDLPKINELETFTNPGFRDKGAVVVFPSWVRHRVSPVTRGTRYVAIFWTTSIILDPFIRKRHSDLTNIQLNLDKLGYAGKTYTNIKDFIKDPSIEIEMVKKNLIRRYL